MSGKVTVRTRRFMTNRLLSRKQMVVDVIHPGRANVPKSELREKVADMYHVKKPETVVLFGFRTAFGGGRSSGFCLIYDTTEHMKRVEPKFRLVRMGLATKEPSSAKQRKERKNRAKKCHGKKRAEILRGGS